MPRGVKRQPEVQVKEPVVEAVVDPVEPVVEAVVEPVVAEVKPELKFGDDPDDLYGASETPAAIVVAEALGRTTKVVYSGLRVAKGARADSGPIAVTLTVPQDREPDYERMVTEGVTYTLHRGQPCSVAEDDAEWLINYPAYLVAMAQ